MSDSVSVFLLMLVCESKKFSRSYFFKTTLPWTDTHCHNEKTKAFLFLPQSTNPYPSKSKVVKQLGNFKVEQQEAQHLKEEKK